MIMTKQFNQIKIVIIISLSSIKIGDTQDFKNFFVNCHKYKTEEFDKCIKNALNDMRIFYKSGKNNLSFYYKVMLLKKESYS